MSKALKVSLLGIVTIIGIVCYVYLTTNQEAVFGSTEVPGTPDYGRIFIGYIVTCFGVLIGSFYRKLGDLKKTNPQAEVDGTLVKSVFRSVDLWLGISGSPLVFGLVLQSASDIALPGFIMIALQNGFCCLALIEGITRSESKPVRKGPVT